MKHPLPPLTETTPEQKIGQRCIACGQRWKTLHTLCEKLDAHVSLVMVLERDWQDVGPTIRQRFWETIQDLLHQLMSLCQQLEEDMIWMMQQS